MRGEPGSRVFCARGKKANSGDGRAKINTGELTFRNGK